MTFRLYPNERTTTTYGGQVKDSKNVNVPLSDIATLTLTLYDSQTLAIINARDNVDIKNANGGTVSSTGAFEFKFSAADLAIIDPTKIAEDRVALINWTSAGGNEGHQEVFIHVKNLNKVP